MNLILLYFIINFMWIGICTPRKRKADVEPNTEKSAIVKYEKEHYDDFLSKIPIYERWPEVNFRNAKDICKKQISKIQPNENAPVKEATVEKVKLWYSTSGKILELTALRCVPISRIYNRKFFYFLRTPDTRCVYLLQNFTTNSKIMKIALKICEFHSYVQLRDDIKEIYSLRHCSRVDDKPDEIAKFEESHLLAFLSNRALYETWPELENRMIMMQYCMVFIGKLFPESQFDFDPEVGSITLLYTSFITGPGINVATLYCNTSTAIYRNSQRFIRALSDGPYPCVYLIRIKNVGRRKTNTPPDYKISKKLCTNENDSINQHEIEVLKDSDFMIDEAQKIFDQFFFKKFRNKITQQSDDNIMRQ